MAQDNPRLYVGGVPKQATREDFEEYFRAKGKCDEIILMGNDPHRGFGFIQYSDPDVANQVLSEKHTLKGIQMGVKVATKKETRLFLGGLQSTVTEEKVRQMLTGYALEKLQVFPERGIGFVTIVGSNDAVNRLLKQEQEIDGKKIRMTIANPRQSDLDGRGRGRGRGRGGRGRGGSGWDSFVPGGGYGAPAYGYGPPGYGYGGSYGAPQNPYGAPRGGYGGGAPRGGYGGGAPRGGYSGGRGSGYGGGRGAGQNTGYQTSTPQFGYNQPAAGGYGQQDRGGAAARGGYQTTSPYNQQYSQQYAPY